MVMWVEKYRPISLDEVINQKETIKSLKSFLKTPQTMPHLLFAGPAGTGKTSAALCIARHLLGGGWRDHTLELNASDERGIQMVRERVKSFSRHATGTLGNIPFNLVILDESDQMTSSAQTALRRIMEANSRISRFILICNYSSKIIAPIQSRCAIFRFSALRRDDVTECLRSIAEKEDVKLSEEGINAIVDFCEGDLRRAINTLQAASTLGGKVDEKIVLQIVGQAKPTEVLWMLEKALDGDFIEAREKLYELLNKYGLSGTDVVRQIHREVMNLNIDERAKVELADVIGEYDFRLTEGANEDIQLSALLAQFTRFNVSRGKSSDV